MAEKTLSKAFSLITALIPSIQGCMPVVPHWCLHTPHLFICIFSHENRFLLAGLKVKKHPDWSARQAAYLAAVKDFLVKLKPEFATLPVQFVRAIRYELKTV